MPQAIQGVWKEVLNIKTLFNEEKGKRKKKKEKKALFHLYLLGFRGI